MADWRDCKLGDLLQIKHGFAFLGEHFSNIGTHIVLTPGNFLEEGGFKENGEKAKWYDGPIPSDYVLKEGDLIIAMTEQGEGLLGSSAIVPRSDFYLHNQRLGLVQIRDRTVADQHFVYYLFNSKPVRQQIRGSASGAKIRHTAPSRIAEVKVRIPPLPVQRRIAGILSAYDELMENSQRRIKIMEAMARALYREWFVELRFPGHERLPRVASPMGAIPRGWDPVLFTEIADVLSGGTPKTDVSEYWNGEIPFFTPRDAPTGFYVQDTEKHITELGLSECASELYPPDTVFITARGTVGKVALSSVPMAMNQSCYALRGRTGIPQRFLFLMTLEQVDYLRTNTGGATFDTIVVDTFRGMKVVKPDREIVVRFARQTDAIFEQVNTLQRQIENLRRTRDLLLPRLLSGGCAGMNYFTSISVDSCSSGKGRRSK
jgi:type I restriction enzyme S subunit